MLCTGWVPPSFSHTKSNLSLDLSLQVQARKAHLFSSTTLLSHSPQLLLRSSPAACPRNPPPQLARVIPVSAAPPSGHKLMLRPTASPAISSVEPSSTTGLSTSGPCIICWVTTCLVGVGSYFNRPPYRSSRFFSCGPTQSHSTLLWMRDVRRTCFLIFFKFFIIKPNFVYVRPLPPLRYSVSNFPPVRGPPAAAQFTDLQDIFVYTEIDFM